VHAIILYIQIYISLNEPQFMEEYGPSWTNVD